MPAEPPAAPAAQASTGAATHSYVGLVRGINVGQNNQISMADFRALFERLGYTSVVTLLRSGNVVFEASGALTAADTATIEHEFERAAGFRAGFVIVAADRFRAIIAENPLLSVGTDPSKLVITFLPEAPDATGLTLPDPDALLPEVVALGTDAIYSWHPLGISNSKLPASFWRQFGAVYTARNLNTVTKLAALLDAR